MSAEATNDVWSRVLGRYDLGEVLSSQQGGGTAAPKILIATAAGRFLVRRRRPESSAEAVVAFDHGVIIALAGAGLPTVKPRVSRDGGTWVRLGDHAYEVFPFVEGLERFSQGDRARIAAAGTTLARFHRATAGLRPPGRKDWPREHEVGAMAATLEAVLASVPPDAACFDEAHYMLASARELQAQLTAGVVSRLPHVITHGDYTPANIAFRGDRVAGIFDLDWVSRQARLQDVGEAVQVFAFRRAADIDPDSIWSLVQTWEPDLELMRVFLAAYQTEWPLGPDEAEALPLFMRETWLGIRIRAMRKVAPEERLRILAEGALAPLRWLQHEADLITAVAGETAP